MKNRKEVIRKNIRQLNFERNRDSNVIRMQTYRKLDQIWFLIRFRIFRIYFYNQISELLRYIFDIHRNIHSITVISRKTIEIFTNIEKWLKNNEIEFEVFRTFKVFSIQFQYDSKIELKSFRKSFDLLHLFASFSTFSVSKLDSNCIRFKIGSNTETK